MRVDGADFIDSYKGLKKAITYVRKNRAPILVHANCPLLGHHTSGVRKEWYRGEDLDVQQLNDPIVKFEKWLSASGETEKTLSDIRKIAYEKVAHDYQQAIKAADPDVEDFDSHEFAPTPVTEEKGERLPKGAGPRNAFSSSSYQSASPPQRAIQVGSRSPIENDRQGSECSEWISDHGCAATKPDQQAACSAITLTEVVIK
ncbi:MAG: pyruvate dehydrogenase (acetyl-transferring) E1 component, alpha subunit [Candidatus Accumulibacter vicinus]|uniref:2-oxoisovalerate dehydrogenase subunit alpha n=2 Tax=Candidatus Accumulibacter vicinus TaxID=2954382 RepID=A0A084XWG8_9PROT|nr:MAG: pyruvate dehydrogenase (acetyl-transferring) E1 component, alpha subunit [Candidatus Accumulibacter vicinus]